MAKVVGPKADETVAAPSLTASASPATANEKETAAAAVANAQPEVQKYNKKFLTHQKYNRNA
jgi:hypothetical protein